MEIAFSPNFSQSETTNAIRKLKTQINNKILVNQKPRMQLTSY
jgi:hypothetical protein